MSEARGRLLYGTVIHDRQHTTGALILILYLLFFFISNKLSVRMGTAVRYGTYCIDDIGTMDTGCNVRVSYCFRTLGYDG